MVLVGSSEAAGVAEVLFPAAVGDMFGGVVPAVAMGHGEEPVYGVGVVVEGFVGIRRSRVRWFGFGHGTGDRRRGGFEFRAAGFG
jgi:spore maturation protein SpmB